MKKLSEYDYGIKRSIFVIAVILVCSACLFPSCSDNSDDTSENIHAYFFEVSDSPVSAGSVSCYMAKLKSSLAFCPENLVVPKQVNGKNVEGLYADAFGAYTIRSVYVHSNVKYIPYLLLSESSVQKITVPEKFRDDFFIPTGTEVIYY